MIEINEEDYMDINNLTIGENDKTPEDDYLKDDSVIQAYNMGREYEFISTIMIENGVDFCVTIRKQNRQLLSKLGKRLGYSSRYEDTGDSETCKAYFTLEPMDDREDI